MHTEKMVVLIQKATIYDLMRITPRQGKSSLCRCFHSPRSYSP